MTRPNHPLELLAPAKNADFGIEAIKHGADAVYIGGPAFGARYGAGNDVAEIKRLCDFAHRFNARVFVALNTILHDEELEEARQLAWKLYEAGADALIIQDMGLQMCIRDSFSSGLATLPEKPESTDWLGAESCKA